MESSTTLITFLFHCPQSVQTVELFGSWDNFTTAYPMERDLRKGSRFWSGCYTFDNIVCDGDAAYFTDKRTGGLKMGGTYWYYYLLDGDRECYDDTRLSTTTCPLLPGQRLNVMEVPMDRREIQPVPVAGHVRTPSSPLLTMDPNAKFVNPRPAPSNPVTTSNNPNILAQKLSPVVSAMSVKGKSNKPLQISSPIISHGPAPPSTAHHLPVIVSGLSSTSRKRSKSVSSVPTCRSKTSPEPLTPQRRASDSDADERSQARPGTVKGLSISSPIPTEVTHTPKRRISGLTKAYTSLQPPLSKPHMDSPRSTTSSTFSPLRSHPPTAHDEMAFAEGTLESLKTHAISSIAQSTLASSLAQLKSYGSSAAASSCESVIRRSTSSHSRSRESSPVKKVASAADVIPPTNTLDVSKDVQTPEECEHTPRAPVAILGAPMPLTFSSVAAIPEEPIVISPPSSSTLHLNKRLPNLPGRVPMPPVQFAPPADWNITPMGELGSKFSAWSSDTARSSLTLEPISPLYPGSPTFSSTATNTTLNSPHRLSAASDYETMAAPTRSSSPPSVGTVPPTLMQPPSLTQSGSSSPVSAIHDHRRQGICVQSNPQEFAYSLPKCESQETVESRTKVRAEMAKLAEILGEEGSSTNCLEQFVTDFHHVE